MSPITVGKIIKKLGFTYKRAIHSTPCTWSQDKVENFEDMLRNKFSHPLISIDECNFSEKTLPFRGYSQKGTRLVTKLSRPSWKATSLLMAVSSSGEYWYTIVNGSVNGETFENFVSKLPNNPIILDNASIHRTKHDPRKIFIPPYSPKYNPIEMIFSKVKRHFRRLMQDASSRVNENIHQSVQSIQPTDIINTFSHVSRMLACESA